MTLLTDINGSPIERYRYDAFGAPTFYTGTWGTGSNTICDNRFLFTGREYAATYRSTYITPAFNFYEYRARAYNPTLGRFMSEDPKLFVHRDGLGASLGDWTFGTHPDEAEFNLFRYCGNDPIDFKDPMGLDPVSDFIAGTGDMVTFGQSEKIADYFFPGYSAAIDHSSAAYKAGQSSGLLVGMATGEGEAAAARAGARAGERAIGAKAAKAAVSNEKAEKAAQAIEDHLGGKGEIKLNKHGDPLITRDNKRIRIDANNPHGDKPHFHIEKQTDSGKWKDAGDQHRYYLKEREGQ